MTNIESLNQSMNHLVKMLYDATNEGVETKTYELLSQSLDIVTDITTNIKRMVECGITLDSTLQKKEDEK